jgi:hypothetical protein
MPAAHAPEVERALRTAIEALVERAQFYDLVLHDPDMHGLENRDSLRDRIATDQSATVVIRDLLARGWVQER